MEKVIKIKKENFLSINFRKSVKDLNKIKFYFWFSFILFFAITLFGIIFPIFFVERIYEIIENLTLKTHGMNAIELVRFIMTNNIMSAFIGIISGLSLGIMPIIVIIVNSYILGFVINKSVAVAGPLIIWRLFPHGIFEIPAILISVSLGIRLGYLMMYNCINKYNKKLSKFMVFSLMFISIILFPISLIFYILFTLVDNKLRGEFFNNIILSLRIFIFIIVPLLFIAGIIEGILIYVLG